jgi:predicted PurR-regulated permease PerM
MTAVRERIEFWMALISGVALRIIIAVLGVYVLFRIRFILVTLLISAILAFVVNPIIDAICRWLRYRKCSRLNRAFVTFILFVAFAIALGAANYVLFRPLQKETARLADNWPQFRDDVKSLTKRVSDWYGALPETSRQTLNERVSALSDRVIARGQKVITRILEWLSHIVELVVIPVIAFYFAADYRAWKRDVLYVVPRSKTRTALRMMRISGRVMQSYVIGQLLLCLIAGIVIGVMLWAVGIEYALLLAVAAGVARAIPVVGPIFGSAPVVGITWALGGGWMALLVTAFLLVLYFLENKLVLPLVIGGYMRLHPLTVIIVLLVGFEFLGVLGMFIAPPVAAIVKETIIYYTRKRTEPEPAA